MATKLNFKKSYRNLYLPKEDPMMIDVPAIPFFMAQGTGDPNEENGAYANAVSVLYGLSYGIKMSKQSKAIDGYFEYVVPPLEGLWWFDNDRDFDRAQPFDKNTFHFIAMIRQPDFVDQSLFKWALSELNHKKPELHTAGVRFVTWTEGLCVQCMHIGSYDDEKRSIERMERYIVDNGYENAIGDALPDGTIRRHHEIYLGDPRKTSPEKLKTVLRHPVKKTTHGRS